MGRFQNLAEFAKSLPRSRDGLKGYFNTYTVPEVEPVEYKPPAVSVPFDVLDSKLSPQALSLYVLLSAYVVSRVHVDDVAGFAGVQHVKSAYRYLDELQASTWVEWWKREGKFIYAKVSKERVRV